MNQYVLAPICVLTLAAAAAAQSGRTMQQNTPAFIGSTIQFQLNHPTTASGNLYAFLWSPPYAPATPITIPGMTVVGDARVDPNDHVVAFQGVLDSTGARTHSVTVPNTPGFIGYPFDLQSVDLEFGTLTLSFADNDLAITISAGMCGVTIAQAASNSNTIANADIQSITNANLGAPSSQGLPAFSYLVTRHRGDDGTVAGYQGTFSATAFNSDMDSASGRRVGRAMHAGGYQVVSCPNGYDISLIRDFANPKQFSILSFERATGIARIVPGSTWTDTSTTATPAQQVFYPGFSRDGQWAAVYVKDSNTAGFAPMVWAFRTDGMSPVVDITPAGTVVTDAFFDGTLTFTNDFLLASGSVGFFWTSATAPAQLQPLATPNTAASNMPNVWAFPFAWRISPDGSRAFLPLSGLAANSRGEMDVAMLVNNGGTPLVTNHSQFAAATGVTEFGYAGITPSTANNSSQGLKASVSPDGTKLAFLTMAAAGATTSFTGICVADGTANPPIHSVAGAAFYSEVVFLNNTTVLFFAGAANTTQSFYSLDVPTGAITQIGSATDIRTRGQFWSLNRNWWYFIRSDTGATKHNIVAVNAATGAVHDVTGSEFGGGGSVGNVRSPGTTITTDPWFALEMMMRRAPVGDYVYFAAREDFVGSTSTTYEDANIYRFDAENGGAAVRLSNNSVQGTTTQVRYINSLTIAADGNHVAWAERVGTATANSEDVWHLDLTTNTLMQVSVSNPTGQSITDGQLRFTCNPPTGLAWSIGTGSTSVPTANTKVQWVPLGSNAPIDISQAPAGTRLYWLIGAVQ
ncbi:MAG: hypothetical protein U1E73_00915 [Planctomycetota bacterium]